MDTSRPKPSLQTRPRSATALALALLIALTAVMLTGCGTSALPLRSSEPARQYLLEWQPASHNKPLAGTPVLQVSATRAAAGFGSSDMLYSRQPHRLERFTRHRWADSPARMLAPLLVKSCEASGLFGAVAAPGTPIQADLRLETEVLQMQQVFSNGDSRLELVLRATLIDVAGARQTGSRTFRITEPAPPTPYDGVQAANRAVARLLNELTDFLASHAGP